VTNAHDGSDRLFILEQEGRIKVLQPGVTTPTLFLDLTSRVLAGGELGLAFHPQFANNRRFFVNYTRKPDGTTVIAEYHVATADGNIADTQETILLTVPQPFANHNGGMIEFGPDSFLYIGMGDGGSGNDPDNRAQNTEDLLGKSCVSMSTIPRVCLSRTPRQRVIRSLARCQDAMRSLRSGYGTPGVSRLTSSPEV